jgi:hypothetical protein
MARRGKYQLLEIWLLETGFLSRFPPNLQIRCRVFKIFKKFFFSIKTSTPIPYKTFLNLLFSFLAITINILYFYSQSCVKAVLTTTSEHMTQLWTTTGLN